MDINACANNMYIAGKLQSTQAAFQSTAAASDIATQTAFTAGSDIATQIITAAGAGDLDSESSSGVPCKDIARGLVDDISVTVRGLVDTEPVGWRCLCQVVDRICRHWRCHVSVATGHCRAVPAAGIT
jgi:hypothetical protein